MAELLLRGTSMETNDIDRFLSSTPNNRSILRSIRNFLLFPIFLTNVAIKLSFWFFSFSMLMPCMALLWRRRKYLADACAVQLTRNPDGLAEALRKLNAERGPIPGGAWASHLFLVSPGASDRVDDPRAAAEQKQTLARIWAASAGTASASVDSPPAAPSPADSLFMSEILSTGQAAVAGDQAAAARMMAFRQAMAVELGMPIEDLPDIADLAAAHRGDPASLGPLRALNADHNATQQVAGNYGASSELSSANFAGFFPSIKRRLKRLDRMGAHVVLGSEPYSPAAAVFIGLLALFLAPFAILCLVLFLVLIAILTLSSLAFMAIWMAFIHHILMSLPHR